MDDGHICNPTLLVRPSFSGKTHFMLRALSRISDRDFFRNTEPLAEQYSISKIKIEEIGGESEPLTEYRSVIIVFDDFLGTSISKYKDIFIVRGR